MWLARWYSLCIEFQRIGWKMPLIGVVCFILGLLTDPYVFHWLFGGYPVELEQHLARTARLRDEIATILRYSQSPDFETKADEIIRALLALGYRFDDGAVK